MSDAPILKAREDGRWELAEDWQGIPAGFVTDGASVPRFFWRVLGAPVEAKTIGAFVKHDWAYQTGAKKRKAADGELYDDLRASGVSKFKAACYWLGVRAFGWLHYYKEEQA